MATYASIKYDMDLASSATGEGAMTLLATETASSSATISFTSDIDSTYKEYIFRFYDIHPSGSNQTFSFQADTGTNTSYNQTIDSTLFITSHDEADTATSLAYSTGGDQWDATGFQRLMRLTNDNDNSGAGILHLFDPSNSTFVKHFVGTCTNTNSNTYTQTEYSAGYFNTTTAITRVQFKFDSGNIDAGVIKMYGVA